MKRYKTIPAWSAAPVLLLGSLLFTLLALLISPGGFSGLQFAEEPLLLPLNWLPCFLLSAFLWGIFRNPFPATAAAGLLVNLLAYANRIKTGCRNDPLMPADLADLREALTATSEYSLDLHWGRLAAILFCCAAAAALGLFFRCTRPKWYCRLAASVAAAALFFLSMGAVYGNTALYAQLVPAVDKADVPLTYRSLGFPYCFLANYDRYTVQPPEDYFREEVERWAQADTAAYTVPDVQPNIIFVMCESFTDLADADAFSYVPEESPLYGYHQVAASGRAVSGHLIVPNSGAGTANTEFDVLTGMQTERLGTNSAFRTVRRQTNSLPRAFQRAGYESFFLHPGYSWFYNRESVYDYLGITDCIFQDEFAAEEYKGPTVSDAAFLSHLTAALEARLGDAPLFAFGVTIQNHQAYTYQKYGTQPAPLPCKVNLSEEEAEALSVYLEGVRDASEMLLRLTEYLDAQSEPFLLVFFGDHRPALPESVYHALGADKDALSAYETPYLIWANKAYTGDLPALPERMNASYLGAAVYALAGLSGLDPYFDELEAAQQVFSVTAHGQTILADGTAAALTPAQRNLLHRLDCWAYYRLKDEPLIE